MTFIPTFRHFRIYNVISLTGTAYSALYLIIAATCKSSAFGVNATPIYNVISLMGTA